MNASKPLAAPGSPGAGVMPPGASPGSRLPAGANVWLATAAVAAAGAGVSGALAGWAMADLGLAIAGGIVTAAALVLLVSAGWLDGVLIVALSLPLPALYSTESVRIAPAAAATAAVTFALFLRRGLDGRTIELGVLPRRPIILFLAAMALATVFAQNPLVALRELINMAVLAALLVVATDELTATPRRAQTLALAVAATVALCGALAVLEAVGVLPGRFPRSGTSFNRAALGFGWPNELGMFIALALPLAVHACAVARGFLGRALAVTGLGTTVLGLAATFSRGSWLAVLAATLVLLVAGERRFVLRVWIVALIAIVVIDAVSGGAIRGRITSITGDWAVTQRAGLMLAGLLMFRAHPIIGVGPGGFAENLDRYGPHITWLWDYIGSSHNVYIHLAAETGVVGLGAFLVFLAAAFVVLFRGARRARSNPRLSPAELSLRRALLWSFATACMVGMVEWLFAHGIGQLIMLVAAMGFALEGRSSTTGQAPP